MSFRVGIVGLPNVGKSSLFQVLTKKQVDRSNYPFATVDPNVGVVAVPDERLARLTELERSARTIPTTIEFVDIAGLVKGAHKGEGLGNQFLAHIREVDAIAEVVRAFPDPDVTHVAGRIDPKDDAAVIDVELAMADLEVVEKRLDTATKQAKAGVPKELDQELQLLKRLQTQLRAAAPIRTLKLSTEERQAIRSYNLLTAKPLLYVLNIAEEQVRTTRPEHLDRPSEAVLVVALKVEEELENLDPAEAREYLASLGWEQSGLDRLIQASYRLLHLLTFFTTGPDETRAWTIPEGTAAPAAAGVIHTDFEKHFIRAEIVSYEELVSTGSWEQAKLAGKLRIEGKAYIMHDGDVAFFRVDA